MSSTSIIVTYHTGELLFDAITSACQQNEAVIVIDNGNRPEIRTRLKHLEHITLITPDRNIGFAAACNMGAAHANTTYVLFQNPDCILQDGVVDALGAALSDVVWLAGAACYDAKGKYQAYSCRNPLSFRSILGHGLHMPWLGRMFVPPPTENGAVPVVSGACMMLERQRFLNIGGFDEAYFLHVEDVVLSNTIIQQGGQVMHVPAAKAIHHKSSSQVDASFIRQHKYSSLRHYLRERYAHQAVHRIGVGGLLWLIRLWWWLRDAVRAAF